MKYPDSKPIWDDKYHLLTYFACYYTQKHKLKDYHNAREYRLMKCIMKGEVKYGIAFCLKWMTDEYWTLHTRNSYMQWHLKTPINMTIHRVLDIISIFGVDIAYHDCCFLLTLRVIFLGAK